MVSVANALRLLEDDAWRVCTPFSEHVAASQEQIFATSDKRTHAGDIVKFR